MREIRFRSWSNSQNRMMEADYVRNGIWSGNEKDFPEIVMQFTGLRDARGTEIYEGDIVRFTPSVVMDMPPYTGQIAFEHYAFILRDSEWHHTTLCDEFGPMLEVLGNVYQNPELLK